MLSKSTYEPAFVAGCKKLADSFADAPPELQVLALDRLFVHRARGGEAKGGACKQVRDLADAVTEGGSVDVDVAALREAYFAEIEARFA